MTTAKKQKAPAGDTFDRAFLRFQQACPTAPLDAVNSHYDRSGGGGYATLTSLLQTAAPQLNAAGLAFSFRSAARFLGADTLIAGAARQLAAATRPAGDECPPGEHLATIERNLAKFAADLAAGGQGVGVVLRLLHAATGESRDYVGPVFPVQKGGGNRAHALRSVITYAKRAVFSDSLGMSTGTDDDDGNQAGRDVAAAQFAQELDALISARGLVRSEVGELVRRFIRPRPDLVPSQDRAAVLEAVQAMAAPADSGASD